MEKSIKFYGNQIYIIAKKMDMMDVMEFERNYSKQERLYFPTLFDLFHLIRNMDNYQQLLIVEFWIDNSNNTDILNVYMKVLYDTLLNYLRTINRVWYLSIVLRERIFEMKFLKKIKAYDVFLEEWNHAMILAKKYKISSVINELDTLKPRVPIKMRSSTYSVPYTKRVI